MRARSIDAVPFVESNPALAELRRASAVIRSRRIELPISRDQRTALRFDCDVLVVGGGAAGVAAAVVAARRGARVVLAERYGFCGGGAVAGMSGTICGMYAATDDRGAPPRQVVHGFLNEFVAEMERRGGLTDPLLR